MEIQNPPASGLYIEKRRCKKCGQEKLLDKKYFGHNPQGGYRWSCRECKGIADIAYAAKNPKSRAERSRMRQARVAKSGGNGASYSEKMVIRKMLGDRCAYCGEALNGKGHFDHMNPIAKGGLDAAINMTLACPSCNEEKHSKTVEQYALWREKCGLLVLFHPSVKSKKERPQKTVQKSTWDTAEFKPNEAPKAKVTVATFAEELGIHKTILMAQLYKAGIKKESPEETLSTRDKGALLDYLRKVQQPKAKNLSA